jgi:hypothetical protein
VIVWGEKLALRVVIVVSFLMKVLLLENGFLGNPENMADENVTPVKTE